MLFDQFNDRIDKGLPLTYDVRLRYRGPEGRKTWEHPYRLDLGMYFGAALPEKCMPEIATELENIRKEIKKWTGEGGHVVLVHARDQERKDRLGRRRMCVHVYRREGPKALSRMLAAGEAAVRTSLKPD